MLKAKFALVGLLGLRNEGIPDVFHEDTIVKDEQHICVYIYIHICTVCIYLYKSTVCIYINSICVSNLFD